MALKKITQRNGSATLTGLVISILIVMGIFIGSYLYFEDNVDSANLTMDSKYETAYSNLILAQEDLKNNVNAIQDSFTNIQEADDIKQVAWNGLILLGATLLLPISFVSTTLKTWTAILDPMDILPGWVLPLVFIGLTAFVIFLVLKVLKGEPNM